MSAGIPDGWTRWRRTWSAGDMAHLPEDTRFLELADIAIAEAVAEGLEVDRSPGATQMEQSAGSVTVILTVRPADGSTAAEFRE